MELVCYSQQDEICNNIINKQQKETSPWKAGVLVQFGKTIWKYLSVNWVFLDLVGKGVNAHTDHSAVSLEMYTARKTSYLYRYRLLASDSIAAWLPCKIYDLLFFHIDLPEIINPRQ